VILAGIVRSISARSLSVKGNKNVLLAPLEEEQLDLIIFSDVKSYVVL